MELLDTQKGNIIIPEGSGTSMDTRKKYTAEYKKEVVKLITEAGKKPAQVARDIGVHETTLYKWLKQYTSYGNEAFPGKGNLRSDAKELKDMKKRIADLEEENVILKKAMAIFSKDVR